MSLHTIRPWLWIPLMLTTKPGFTIPTENTLLWTIECKTIYYCKVATCLRKVTPMCHVMCLLPAENMYVEYLQFCSITITIEVKAWTSIFQHQETLSSILNYLTMSYWKEAIAIHPSRKSVFPSESEVLSRADIFLYCQLTKPIQENIKSSRSQYEKILHAK